MSNEALRNLIIEYTDAAWNRGDVDAMDRYYGPNYRHHDVSRPDVQTLADYKQWARDLLAGLSNFHVTADDVFADGNKVVKRWTVTGINTGSIAGIPPTNQPVSFSGASFYRVENGKIAESWYVYDLFGLVQKLTQPAAVSA